MRRLLLPAVVGLACCFPAVAAAQTANRDSVGGTASFGEPQFGVTASINARTAPSGENATGSATYGARQTFFGGPVTCLNVTGNRAVIGGDSGFVGPAGYFFVVVDNSATGAPDLFGILFPPPAEAPTTCPSNLDVPLEPASSGDLVVNDAEPPDTYAQCRHAGWVNYGYASRPQCIDGVHEYARKKCIFERAAIGIVAFRSKYGLNANGDHAMRHCVRLHTGF